MILLTLTEGDGTATRIPIGVFEIACSMAAFFQDLGLGTAMIKLEDGVSVDRSQTEMNTATLFMAEWRKFGNVLTAV